jgi:enoyl-CoA hydratase
VDPTTDSLNTATTGDFRYLGVELVDGIAVVSMHRPPVNAVNQEMYGELRELFSRANEFVPEASAVVLRGDGPHFCAGNDLGEFLTLSPQNSPGRMKLVREAFAAIYDCPVPVIAAVHGSALGTGLAIAGSCDLVVCSEGARFGVPEVSVGVMGGAKHLSRLVPQQVLRKMYFTADPVPGSELARFGGVTEVVSEERLLDAAFQLARRIARHSPVALRTAKESLNMIEYMELKAGYETEQRFTAHLSGSADSAESRRAIVEKRQPSYSPFDPRLGI